MIKIVPKSLLDKRLFDNVVLATHGLPYPQNMRLV